MNGAKPHCKKDSETRCANTSAAPIGARSARARAARQAPRGELPAARHVGELPAASSQKVRTRTASWDDAEARWEDAQSALRWEASRASHDKGSLRYDDPHGLSGRVIVERELGTSGSD